MNRLFCFSYDASDELLINSRKEMGEYWQFINTPIEELNHINFDNYDYVCSSIIPNIKNQNLKNKMIEKVLYAIKYNGIFKTHGLECFESEVFSEEQIKSIIDNDIFLKKEIYEKPDDTNEKYKYIDKVYALVNYYVTSKDMTWKILGISNLIDSISPILDSEDFKKTIVRILEITKYDKELFNFMMYKNRSIIPLDYRRMIEIENDDEYLLKMSKSYEKRNLSIGIDENIKIGPEVELNNKYGIRIKLSNQKELGDLFNCHIDATVYDGIEVSCKPFHDNNKELSRFAALLDSLSLSGYYVDEKKENAAGQINLGLDYLDSNEAIMNFYRIYCNSEEILYYISDQFGELTRQGIYNNSRYKPLSEIIGINNIDENISRKELINRLRPSNDGDIYNNTDGNNKLNYKKNSMGIRGSYDSDLRIEFRIPNGSINYETWFDNIRLYGKMFEVAKKIADNKKSDNYSEVYEEKEKLMLSMIESKRPLDKQLEDLMNLLFEDNEIKEIYYKRFYKVLSLIKETRSEKYTDIMKTEPSFDKVDFVEEYKTKLDDEEPTVYYDPETEEYFDNSNKRRKK